MLLRFKVWIVFSIVLLATAAPTHAAPQPQPSQAALTNRVYLPIASADLSRRNPLRIVSDRRYLTSYGSLFVVGEITNDGTTPVYGVELEATFFDAAGQVIDTVNDYARLEQTKPGQRNPFRLTLFNQSGRVARHEVRVVNWRTTSPYNPQPLTTLSQGTRNNDGLEIFGEVRNTSQQTLTSTLVVATLYDAKGNVVDVVPDVPLDANAGYRRSSDYTVRYEMAPGSTSIYNMRSLESLTTYATYTVQAEGFVAAAPAPAFSLRVSSAPPISNGTNRISVGEVINESTTTAYDIELEARFYDSNNQLVAVARSFSLLGLTGPAQRTPFEIVLPNAPIGVTRTEISAYGFGTGMRAYQPITVVSRSDAPAADGTAQVTGRVRNPNTSTLSQTYVAVTYYNSNGKVVDVAFGYANVNNQGTPQPLAAGAETDYLAFNERSITYATYSVQGEGYTEGNALQQRVDIQRKRAFTYGSRVLPQRALGPVSHLKKH